MFPSVVQRQHEGDHGGGFFWRDVSAKGGHVAPALNHLPNQLVAIESCGHVIEFWTAMAAQSFQGVAVSTLFVLNDQRTLQLQRRTALQVILWCGHAAPRVHDRRPR